MTALRTLPYQPVREGRELWIKDGALADPDGVRARCLARADWRLGAPHRPESWPGMRAPGALSEDELGPLEAWVRAQTGAARLWIAEAPGGARLDHNVAQLVGAAESGPRPHTDSRALCRYAAVLYLTPGAPDGAGTSFFRLRAPDGSPGGNVCPPPHTNLVEALGVRRLPPGAWLQDVRVANVYNRLLLYRADLVHSASGYCGDAREDRRLTIVFFWMAA